MIESARIKENDRVTHDGRGLDKEERSRGLSIAWRWGLSESTTSEWVFLSTTLMLVCSSFGTSCLVLCVAEDETKEKVREI